jgi:hypothetical protein
LCASAHRGVPLYFCMARSYANFQFTCLVQLFMLQSSDNLQKYEIINNIYL